MPSKDREGQEIWKRENSKDWDKPYTPLKQAMHAVEAQEAKDMIASETDKLLQERGKVHGEWARQSAMAAVLKRTMDVGIGDGSRCLSTLKDSHQEALAMIAVKISRILAGDPNHRDHWDDIAGYARLVSQELERSNA